MKRYHKESKRNAVGFVEKTWRKLNISDIHLNGIHQNLLCLQGQGLTQHIGEVFPDLSDNSAWLGGDGESWERGPYYIDGLIPLAYLLNDETLTAKANHWLNAIINSQDDSGFFGPKTNHDWWPRAVVLKAMVSAYLATSRPDILLFIQRYLGYLMAHIEESPFDFWGYARGMEGKEALDLLVSQNYDIDNILLEKTLKKNTLDWRSFFKSFPYPNPTHNYLNQYLFKILKPFLAFFDALSKKRKKPKKPNRNKIIASRNSKSNLLYLTTHGVNIAMAFKYLLYWQNDTSDMFEALEEVIRYHGNALGLFSSDEHLNGTSADTGIELCTVVEMMYTMEEAMRVKGSMLAADYLETYAYNALLTTIAKDFTAHQYVQQTNQLDCEVKHHHFYDTNKYGNTFGIAPNYGCCAANMHQGWPKMFLTSVMKSEDSIAIFSYVSGQYEVAFDEGKIVFEIETNYPFSDDVIIRCLESTVENEKQWILRIPYHAKTILKQGENEIEIAGQDQYIIKGLSIGDIISLHFDFEVETLINPDQSISVKRGPLIYAYPIPSETFYIKGQKPFHDRGFKPLEKPNLSLVTHRSKIRVVNFKQTIDDKDFFNNTHCMTVSAYDNILKQHVNIDLIPYGMTILRMTQFPRRENDEQQ